MQGLCTTCGAVPQILIESTRARDADGQTTAPVLIFRCDKCNAILGVAVDPEWHGQIVASQVRSVGKSHQNGT